MPISGRPNEYASDRDYAEAMGTSGGRPVRPVRQREEQTPLPGPCVPCAAEGRIAVAGECARHDARQKAVR